MTAFSYSSGNPADLVAGGDAEMIDMEGSFNDVKSFLNGGNLDETNVPNLSAAFTTWKGTDLYGGAWVPTQGAGGTFLMFPQIGVPQGIVAVGAANTGFCTFYLSPTDWTANTRSTKLRLRGECTVNAVAPGVNVVLGLYPVTAFAGASGLAPTISAIGTVITGSTVTFTTPGATSNTVTLSSEFTAPAAGNYVFGVVLGGAMFAGSQLRLGVHLQMRQV